MSRRRVRPAALAAALAVSAGTGLLGWRAAAGAGTPPAVTTLAVLDQHVAYEAGLIRSALPRLPAPAAGPADQAATLLSSLGVRLDASLRRAGYPAARARALWAAAVGDGAPPPSRVLLYVCSVHALESDGTALAATPAASLGEELSGIELTLLVEGRQLAAQLGGPLGAATDAAQREALHVLAGLLVPSDRAFARSA